MNLLVIDTATDRCALACSVDGAIFENTRSIPRLHNKYLLQMLDELFAQAQITPRQLSAIGFAAGPGSFTGVRISAAVCQALAVAANARVVPLASSLLLAEAAKREVLEPAGLSALSNLTPASRGGAQNVETIAGVQTVLRSRRRFAYLGGFRCAGPLADSSEFERTEDDVLLEDEALRGTPLPEGWVRVMDAPPEEAEALGAIAVPLKTIDLLGLTQRAIARAEALPPEGAQPRYVQGDTPWIPR